MHYNLDPSQFIITFYFTVWNTENKDIYNNHYVFNTLRPLAAVYTAEFNEYDGNSNNKDLPDLEKSDYKNKHLWSSR